jgi:hypothetical protein
MIEKIAKACYEQFSRETQPLHSWLAWEELPEMVREAWRNVVTLVTTCRVCYKSTIVDGEVVCNLCMGKISYLKENEQNER